jgi:hypothetical protein
LTGGGFDGTQILGALSDGYNGAGEGFAASAYQDATELIPVGKILAFGGKLLKGAKTISATKSADKVIHIGKLDDLKNVPRNQTILDELPNLGNAKANWKQNSSVLRRKVREGYEIRDVSKHRLNSDPDPTPLRPDRSVGQSFLGAERNLLDNLGVTPR